MGWLIYALAAIFLMGTSDIFRKLASNLKDPIFANMVFQSGAFLMSAMLFATSRKVVNNPRDIMYALIAGSLIALFTVFSFKALSTGPGVSVVMPTLRIGGILLVVILGVLILKEKITAQLIAGLILASFGLYLVFSSK